MRLTSNEKKKPHPICQQLKHYDDNTTFNLERQIPAYPRGAM